MPIISEADFEHWRTFGYVVVKVLDDRELHKVLENIHQYMPSWEEFAQAPPRYEHLGTRRSFPFVGDALNRVTVNPALLAFAERVLGTTRVKLGHSVLVGKYAGTADYEQPLHVDYENNTLAYPGSEESTFELPVITYYTDVTVDLGPTYVVPRTSTRGGIVVPAHRPRSDYADLYEHEVPVTVPAGSSLIYSMTTFHRGSAMRAQEGCRYSHHVTFSRADITWVGQVSFQFDGFRPEMHHFLQRATPRERELVGFPGVGDAYWNRETIAGVSARYPGMDMAPYQEASDGSDS